MAQEEECTMNVQVVSIEFDASLTNAAGKAYKGCEIVYKTEGGNINKKVMHNNTFKYNKTLKGELETFAPKDWIEVTSKKEGEYVNWVSAKKIVAPAEKQPSEAPAQSTASSADVPSRKAVTSNYETPEERAERRALERAKFAFERKVKQPLIIRQSCIGYAIAFFALDKSFIPETENVLTVAREFEAFVNGGLPTETRETAGDTTEPKMPE